jgi:hypothetical protein
VDSTPSTTTAIIFSVLHQLCRAPSAVCLSRPYSTACDLFEEVNWSARLWSGCTKKGGIWLWSSLQRFHFSIRGCCCNLGLLEFTHFREYSHSIFPVRNGSSKIASTELHLPSPLCLHLPKKAIRLELSSIWFQECTYLYSIPCISKVVDACSVETQEAAPMFPALISIVLSSQKPFTVNIKDNTEEYQHFEEPSSSPQGQ